jgi:hypothetical protein
MSSSQGYADGGLTQPQAGTGAYRGIMMPNQSPQMQGQRPTYTPPNSQDPAAQEKKHGLIQSLIDNSIFKAPTTESFMNNLGDMASGKFLSRGFAEGGSLFGYDPNLNSSGLDPRILEAQDAENAARLRATEMVRKMHVGDAANRGVLSKLERDTHPLVKRLMEQDAENAANLRATDIPRKMHLGDAANTKIPQVPPSMTEQLSAAAQKSPLDTMWAKMSEADRLNAMNRANIPPEAKPTPSMTESMSAAAQNPPRVDTMASQMSAADQANSAAKAEAAKAAKSSLIGKGIRSLGLGMGPSAVESMSDIIAPEDWAAKNKALDTGGMRGALGWYADKVGEGFKQGNERIAQNMAGLGDTIKSNIAQPLNEFWNGPQPNVETGDTTSQAPTQVAPPAPTQVAPPAQTPTQTPQQGAIYKDNGVTKLKNSVTVTPDKHIDLDVMSNAHKQPDVQPSQVSEALQKVAASQQAISAIERRPNEEGQGSILDSLYSKLKDSDVDYSDLAKRISQNEYDLARERKDGTFNAILGGVGAALTQAGTYQTAGDRVFKPGLGAIAGAGIMGGLKMSAASDEAISKKSQDNMTAMIALKKLKRESMNDVLDALSAQKQNEVYAQSVANNAIAHRDTAANQKAELGVKLGQLELAAQQAGTETELRLAQINKLRSELDPKKQAAADLLKTQLTAHTTAFDNLAKTPGVMADDPRLTAAANKLKNTNAEIDALLQGFGVNTNLVPENAGSSGTIPRGRIVSVVHTPDKE